MATSKDTGTYIGDSDTAIPADSGTNGKRFNGGAEIRKAKAQAKATFPNFTGAAVTSTEAELNILDGATVATAELNYLDLTTGAGTAEVSKALVADGSGDINCAAVDFNNVDIDSGNIDNVTIGAAAAATITGASLGTAVTAVTQSAGDNSTKVATTAYVDALSTGPTIDTPVTGASTAHDFTIPAGTKRITFTYSGLSTSGADTFIVRLGTGSTPQATGYSGGYGGIGSGGTAISPSTVAFILAISAAAADVVDGSLTLTLVDSTNHIWACHGAGFRNGVNDAVYYSASSVSLSGECDVLRVTTSAGSRSFDAGTINVAYD